MAVHAVTIVEMISRAYREKWALGEFNMSNIETLQAIIKAGEEMNSPVIVGVTNGTIRHAGLPYIGALLSVAKKQAEIPIYFHLDHGSDITTIEACIQLGFDSVMIDSSGLPIDENISLVKSVVNLAHSKNVGVEAQIGETWEEDGNTNKQIETDPEEAQYFVDATGIDYLAVSIGNTPGQMVGKATINEALTEKIAQTISVPLVLHGGSSVQEATVKRLILNGVAKINIDSAIRKQVVSTLIQGVKEPAIMRDPRILFDRLRVEVTKTIKEKIHLFGSSGKIH